MQMNWVVELLRLAGPFTPVEQPSHEDWRKVEAELRLEFPADLKELLCKFGTGWFGGLNFKNPSASAEHLRLSLEGLVDLQEMLLSVKQESPLSLFPTAGGLVPIGGIDRQYFLLKPDKNGKLLEPLLWWDTDIWTLENLEMPVSQFIHHLYLKQIKEEWAENLRSSFWTEGVPFFQPFPISYT
jgi:hypothetical protein